MIDKGWEINHIETKDLAKRVANSLEQDGPKTYFLQGAWGSGKTDYLQEIEKESNGHLKFVYLKLWRPKNNDSLAKKLFSAIHPELSKWLNRGTFIYVLSTILASSWLALKSIFPDLSFYKLLPNFITEIYSQNILLYIMMIITIIISLLIFIKSKTVNEDKFLMYWNLCSLRGGVKKTKVLVIDDFDRLTPELQGELYLLFNAIKEKNKKKNSRIIRSVIFIKNLFLYNKKAAMYSRGKARVIFVGDLDNLEKVKNDYLRKIIDRVISLPFVLNVQSFMPKLEKKISDNLDEKVDYTNLKCLFTHEYRTLRDANKFLFYVENEFIKRKKKGRVQADQQLFIIYLYLFHRKHYKKLYNNLKNKTKKEKKDPINTNDNTINIDNLIEKVLNEENKYPLEFNRNQSNYFIDELSVIHTTKELDEYLDNCNVLERVFYIPNESYDELYNEINYYILSIVENSRYNRDKLNKACISIMRSELRHQPNELLKQVWASNEKANRFEYINNDESNEANERKIPRSSDLKIQIIKGYEEIFDKICNKKDNHIPLTERVYIYRSCFPIFNNGSDGEAISWDSLVNYFSDSMKEKEEDNNFGENDYDSEAILVQLGFSYEVTSMVEGEINGKLETVESKAKEIEKLCDPEYFAFWNSYSGSLDRIKSGEYRYLNFVYNNKETYYCVVKKHLENIKNNISNCVKSTSDSKFTVFLNSTDWYRFMFRIVSTLKPKKFEFQTKIIREKINNLLEHYCKCEKEKYTLSSIESSPDEDKKLEVMQILLECIKKDPKWTQYLD